MLEGKIEISSEIDHFLKFDFPRISNNLQSDSATHKIISKGAD